MGRKNSSYTQRLQPREMCYACYRPTSHCVCQLIKPFQAHCNILILQHPHERKKYYSTAKLVAMALTNAKILRGIEFARSNIEQLIDGQNAYLLYPGKSAKDCQDVVLDSQSTVIVLDGTWSEAGKILYRNPIFKELPCLTFTKPLRSNYRIRKQPKEHYLSTIESVGHLLKLNADACGRVKESEKYESLFNGFDRMVEQQLASYQ